MGIKRLIEDLKCLTRSRRYPPGGALVTGSKLRLAEILMLVFSCVRDFWLDHPQTVA